MEHGPTFSCIGDLYPNLPTHTLTHGHHTTCCKMTELTEFAVHTTRKYHQFDLSRTDGIFDGSQVSGPFKGYFCVRFWTRFGKNHSFDFERLSLQTACAIFACLQLWEGSSWNISSLFKSMCFCPKARAFTVTTVCLGDIKGCFYLSWAVLESIEKAKATELFIGISRQRPR